MGFSAPCTVHMRPGNTAVCGAQACARLLPPQPACMPAIAPWRVRLAPPASRLPRLFRMVHRTSTACHALPPHLPARRACAASGADAVRRLRTGQPAAQLQLCEAAAGPAVERHHADGGPRAGAGRRAASTGRGALPALLPTCLQTTARSAIPPRCASLHALPLPAILSPHPQITSAGLFDPDNQVTISNSLGSCGVPCQSECWQHTRCMAVAVAAGSTASAATIAATAATSCLLARPQAP